MKHFDEKKAKKKIIGAIQRCNFFNDFDIDHEGRLIWCSDLFLHSDFSIWDAPEDGVLIDDEDEDNEEIVEEVISLTQLQQLAQFETEMEQQASKDETTQQGDN